MLSRIIDIDGRQVRYRRKGTGSPVVCIYPNSADLGPIVAALARDHTVFAFDNPGYEASDALVGSAITIADLADALAAAMRVVRLAGVPVFGTHTGAAIAVELGLRHPDLVAGLVLDGVPMFSPDEVAAHDRDGYFTVIEPDALGGQYARCWTRVRDWWVFYPWCRRHHSARRHDGSGADPTAVDAEVLRYFRSSPGFVAPYRAAFAFGAVAAERIAALRVPATFMALVIDELHAHLDRIPAGARIIRDTADAAALTALIRAEIARVDRGGAAPPDPPFIPAGIRATGRYVDLPHGQIHCRVSGDPRNPPLLVLPDAPGSSRQVAAHVAAFDIAFQMHVVDLPGTGGSAPLPAGQRDLAGHADAIAALCRAIADRPVVVHGIGFGATLAAAFAARHPALVRGVLLRGIVMPDAADRAVLVQHLMPPIETGAHGEHWYATWLMLRDSLLFDPWFARGRAAVRPGPVDLDADRLHAWTLDVVAAGAHYADLMQAVLAQDNAPMLGRLTVPALFWRHPADAGRLFGDWARRLPHDAVSYRGHDPLAAMGRLLSREES